MTGSDMAWEYSPWENETFQATPQVPSWTPTPGAAIGGMLYAWGDASFSSVTEGPACCRNKVGCVLLGGPCLTHTCRQPHLFVKAFAPAPVCSLPARVYQTTHAQHEDLM